MIVTMRQNRLLEDGNFRELIVSAFSQCDTQSTTSTTPSLRAICSDAVILSHSMILPSGCCLGTGTCIDGCID